MSLLKWSMIFLYWLWLLIRNMRGKQHDWRLVVQILINFAVILLIVMEDREAFLQMTARIADGVAWLVNWARGMINGL